MEVENLETRKNIMEIIWIIVYLQKPNDGFRVASGFLITWVLLLTEGNWVYSKNKTSKIQCKMFYCQVNHIFNLVRDS